MRFTIVLACSMALSLNACVPEHVFDRDTTAADGTDGTSVDGIDGVCTAMTTVQITSPTGGTVHVNNGVSVQAVVNGCAPDSVDVEVDGSPLAMNVPAPYLYMFDTSHRPEQTYTLVFVATVHGTRIMSSPLMVVVDHTPPTVMMHVPATDASNVAYRAPITITFSEPIDRTTVSPGSFTLTAMTPAGTALSATPSWSTDGSTLTLTPSSAPTFPNRVTLALTMSIHDLAGNALMPVSWGWDVPVWALLGDPTMGNSLTGPSPSAGSAGVLRLRANGTPVLAYTVASGSGDHIQLATWNGSAWTPLGTAMSNMPMMAIPDLAMVLDSTGNPYVVWIEGAGGAVGNVFAAHFDGTNWMPLGASHLNSMGATAPSITLDATGHVLAVWAENAVIARILAVQRFDGTAWSGVGGGQILQPSGGNLADVPEILVDSGGDVIVASLWQGTSTSSPWHLFVHELQTGGSTWIVVTGAPADATAASDEHISMILDSSSHPVIAWTQINGSGGTQIAKTAYTGSAFATDGFTHSIGSGAAAHAHSPWLRFDSMSRPTIGWTESSMLSVLTFNLGAWMPYAASLSDSGSQPVNRLTGEFDANGETVLAWTRSDPAGSGTFDTLVYVANQ